MAKKKKRVTRKQLLKEPDEFLTFSAKAIQFVANNRNSVLGLVIAVVVIAIAMAGFRYYSNVSERKAYALLEQSRLVYLAETLGGGQSPAHEETINKLEEVIEAYPSTAAARFSLLVYGDLSYQRGGYDKAIEMYQKSLEAFAEEGAIQKMIWNGLGHAYEAKQDYSAAAEYFRRITQAPEAFMKVDGYFDLGRMMEALNDREGALEAYKKVLEGERGSRFPMAEEKVSRLRAALEVSE